MSIPELQYTIYDKETAKTGYCVLTAYVSCSFLPDWTRTIDLEGLLGMHVSM